MNTEGEAITAPDGSGATPAGDAYSVATSTASETPTETATITSAPLDSTASIPSATDSVSGAQPASQPVLSCVQCSRLCRFNEQPRLVYLLL